MATTMNELYTKHCKQSIDDRELKTGESKISLEKNERPIVNRQSRNTGSTGYKIQNEDKQIKKKHHRRRKR